MKAKAFLLVSFLLLYLIYSPCAFAGSKADEQKSNLTYGLVKTKITKGQTSQNEVLELFGPPNIVTKNKSGKEVWTYDKISAESKSGSGWGHLIIAGGAFSNSASSSKTVTLMITFDDKDIVEDYSFVQTAY